MVLPLRWYLSWAFFFLGGGEALFWKQATIRTSILGCPLILRQTNLYTAGSAWLRLFRRSFQGYVFFGDEYGESRSGGCKGKPKGKQPSWYVSFFRDTPSHALLGVASQGESTWQNQIQPMINI